MSRNTPKTRVLVAVSGGRHSAVTAAILKSQGFDVVCVHFLLAAVEGSRSTSFRTRCREQSDPVRAREIARKLELPLIEVDGRELFDAFVVDDFVHEFLQQRVPHPCIRCTRHVILDLLFARAEAMGISEVATGHHVQVILDPLHGGSRVTRGVGTRADQSYLMYRLRPSEVARIKTPTGGFLPQMIDRLAGEFALPPEPAESISRPCFIEDPARIPFLEACSAPTLRPRGVVRTTAGDTLGEHAGLHAYPIGSAASQALQKPEAEGYRVVGYDSAQQALLIGAPEELSHPQCLGIRANWVGTIDPLRSIRCKARLSSQGEAFSCYVTVFENERVRVEFDERQGPLIPGQSVVFYDEEDLLGGAVIERVGVLTVLDESEELDG